MVENKFSIKVSKNVSKSTVSRLLKLNDIKRIKYGSFPAKTDVKKREFFRTHFAQQHFSPFLRVHQCCKTALF
jgi:hypothetical protein